MEFDSSKYDFELKFEGDFNRSRIRAFPGYEIIVTKNLCGCCNRRRSGPRRRSTRSSSRNDARLGELGFLPLSLDRYHKWNWGNLKWTNELKTTYPTYENTYKEYLPQGHTRTIGNNTCNEILFICCVFILDFPILRDLDSQINKIQFLILL
jgi:hypothetical protein